MMVSGCAGICWHVVEDEKSSCDGFGVDWLRMGAGVPW